MCEAMEATETSIGSADTGRAPNENSTCGLNNGGSSKAHAPGVYPTCPFISALISDFVTSHLKYKSALGVSHSVPLTTLSPSSQSRLFQLSSHS